MSLMNGIKNFINQQKGEIKKISWPTKNEVINQSILIIIVTFLLALLFWGIDLFLKVILKFILK